MSSTYFSDVRDESAGHRSPTDCSDNTDGGSGWTTASSRKHGNRGPNSGGRGKGRNTSDWHGSRNNGNDNGSRRSRNDYWQHDNRCDTRQGRNFHQKSMNDLQNRFTTLTIRSSDVGKVIGKGGSKIRELQDESGARISVQRSNDPETTVELRGSEEHQKKAKELIEEFLARSNGSGNLVSCNDNAKLCESNDVSNTTGSTCNFIDWDALLASSDAAREKRLAALPPIKRDLYFEAPEVSDMSAKEVKELRCKMNDLTVSKLSEDDNRKIPNPVSTFEQAFKHYPEILEEIKKQNFKAPSPIQCQAWPILLQGHDMIGISQTGSGKTIAFLLPAMIHIDNQPVPRQDRSGPSCLILAPTRELALQIEEEVNKYQYRGIRCVCLYGGASRRDQINVVNKGVEIVVATPGRLSDLVCNNIVDVRGVTYLVLDEADRMLDMGFEYQIRKILVDVRPDKQTVMTSATWPEGVRRLADKQMNKPFQVCIGSLDLTAVHSVTQHVVMTREEDKYEMVNDFIRSMGPRDKVIVFVQKKGMCDSLGSDLALIGVDCQTINGDREQSDREDALNDFKTGRVRILIGTDLVSRGLDVKDVTHIFNYDFPRNIEEYVHRIGRTGRAGRTGESVTLFTPENWRHAEDLVKILEEANQHVPVELYEMARRYQSQKKIRGRGRRRN